MEICLNNQWGTLCDNQWSAPDAGVVCRQAGFNQAGNNFYRMQEDIIIHLFHLQVLLQLLPDLPMLHPAFQSFTTMFGAMEEKEGLLIAQKVATLTQSALIPEMLVSDAKEVSLLRLHVCGLYFSGHNFTTLWWIYQIVGAFLIFNFLPRYSNLTQDTCQGYTQVMLPNLGMC